MKILFYSTNSNHFDGNTFKINTLPSWKNQCEQLCTIYPEHEFIIITQLPGMFLLDLKNNSVKESCSKIKRDLKSLAFLILAEKTNYHA